MCVDMARRGLATMRHLCYYGPYMRPPRCYRPYSQRLRGHVTGDSEGVVQASGDRSDGPRQPTNLHRRGYHCRRPPLYPLKYPFAAPWP